MGDLISATCIFKQTFGSAPLVSLQFTLRCKSLHYSEYSLLHNMSVKILFFAKQMLFAIAGNVVYEIQVLQSRKRKLQKQM